MRGDDALIQIVDAALAEAARKSGRACEELTPAAKHEAHALNCDAAT